MSWTVTRSGQQTRLQLPRASVLGRLTATLLALCFFGVFGPGFLTAGSLHLEVSCTRSGGTTDCLVRQGFLFGLAPRWLQVPGATGAHLDSHRDDDSTQYVPLLVGSSGPVKMIPWSSNVSVEAQRTLVRELDAFLHGVTPDFRSQVHLENLFLLFGIPMTVVWLMILWGLLTWPLEWIRPQALTWDRGRRVLAIQASAGLSSPIELPLREVTGFGLTHRLPGLGGLLQGSQRAVAEDGSPAVPLHLSVKQRSGAELVLPNVTREKDSEMERLRDAIERLNQESS